MRTEAINQSLERTLSRTRLRRYLEVTNDDLDASITLYERNTRLAEALYTTFQGLEICFRNTIHAEMQNRYGRHWLAAKATPLQSAALHDIADTMARIEQPSHDDVVAQLKFSFWVGLLGPRYDNTLWRNALHKGFRAKSGKKRSVVHGRMNALRRFRNRIAHHEPIFENALKMYDEALEAISWMCRDTHAWVSSCSRLPEVHNS